MSKVLYYSMLKLRAVLIQNDSNKFNISFTKCEVEKFIKYLLCQGSCMQLENRVTLGPESLR